MSNELYNQLINMKDNETVNLGGNITAKSDREFAESLDLYENEQGLIVYQAGRKVGSISVYDNGEVLYFSYPQNKDTKVTSNNELISAIKK